MRLIVTSDLHYDVRRSREPTEALAREVCARGGDVLMIVGDTASVDAGILEQALGLFEPFKGAKLVVAGNHELWTLPGGDSLRRYEVELADLCRGCGFEYLDAGPVVLDETAFVGNVGWYDFSFRPSLLGIPLRFYRHKVAPGAARYFDKYAQLIQRTEDVPSSAWGITCRWMDGERVRLPFDDVSFTHRLVAQLRRHLEEATQAADRVVVGLHHLPFAELVPPTIVPNLAFATGFLGSELFGEALLDYPNIRHVFCGHSHRGGRCRKGKMTCVAVGSTYREKYYEAIDL